MDLGSRRGSRWRSQRVRVHPHVQAMYLWQNRPRAQKPLQPCAVPHVWSRLPKQNYSWRHPLADLCPQSWPRSAAKAYFRDLRREGKNWRWAVKGNTVWGVPQADEEEWPRAKKETRIGEENSDQSCRKKGRWEVIKYHIILIIN